MLLLFARRGMPPLANNQVTADISGFLPQRRIFFFSHVSVTRSF
jgi:hypothetical protein